MRFIVGEYAERRPLGNPQAIGYRPCAWPVSVHTDARGVQSPRERRRRENWSRDRRPSSQDQPYDSDNEEDDKKNISDVRGRPGNSGEAKNTGNDRNDQKGYGPAQHDTPP